ncbi:hypothetical protein FB382_003744 [Nocardioides ginsengisegetis]|uniref:Uncharacterized protein n=1 Tax=Nocardioides ginsengisegetis TaxID=661491 RepID=A0A7W3PB88_9ACTN|nr:hypothetical protein [Nocardioides ginsengisegetis]MBA8805453.1 hypothetical protein [Nocardioides ginsengisegetis]
MTELVLRAGHNDHVVLNELLTDPAALPPRHSRYIRRVVVDATAVVHEDGFTRAAYAAGTQLLIDPQTMFLTSRQDPTDNWADLPYATSAPVDPRALLDADARAELIESVVEFQLDHGATGIMPPYLHLTDFAGSAAQVQRLLYKETASHLTSLGLMFALFPVISVDQRAVSLDPAAWQLGLGRVLRAAHRIATGPVGLGLSMTTGPNVTNLHAATRIWRRAASVGPFLAWHAGESGLLAVTMGADGYEVGMCSGERYDVRGKQSSRAQASSPGPRYIGAYVDSIGRSLGLSSVRSLAEVAGVHQGELGCLDSNCCPRGFDSMLGPGRRQHAVRSRLRDLEALDAIGTRTWRLRHLSDRARDSVVSARRIRVAANNTGVSIGANPAELEAMYTVTQNLMATARVSGGGGVA